MKFFSSLHSELFFFFLFHSLKTFSFPYESQPLSVFLILRKICQLQLGFSRGRLIETQTDRRTVYQPQMGMGKKIPLNWIWKAFFYSALFFHQCVQKYKTRYIFFSWYIYIYIYNIPFFLKSSQFLLSVQLLRNDKSILIFFFLTLLLELFSFFLSFFFQFPPH